MTLPTSKVSPRYQTVIPKEVRLVIAVEVGDTLLWQPIKDKDAVEVRVVTKDEALNP